jgi:hypothetical protein
MNLKDLRFVINSEIIAAEQPIGDQAVLVAIDVLKAYVIGTLVTNHCDELDEAIQKAYDVMCANYWRNEYFEE